MKTGTVVSYEKPDVYSRSRITAVVLKGLTDVREGQYLKCGEQVWAVEKRHWVNKTCVALYLHSPSGKLPEIGMTLEVLSEKRGKTAGPVPVAVPKPVKKEKKPKKVKLPIEDIPVDEETR